MTRRWLARISLLALLISGLALAANEFTPFDGGSSRGTTLPATYNGMHFDNAADSSQGWMHLIQTTDGGWITILFTMANIGPYKNFSTVGVLYVHPNGRKYLCSGMWQEGSYFKFPPKDRYWIGVSNSAFGGRYPNYSLKLNDGGCKADISFEATLPSYTQGSGKATFFADKSKFWTLVQIAPRATSKGYIQFKEGRVDAGGDAYLEEVATNMMATDMSDRWAILRAFNGPYTINLFDVTLDKSNFGQGHLRTLLVARDRKIIMGTTHFRYDPGPGKVDAASGISVPQSFSLNARDGATVLTGAVKTGKVLDSMLLLSRLPTVARVYAGLRYGKPWNYRTAAEYDFVLDEGGTKTPLKGVGFKELHFYDR